MPVVATSGNVSDEPICTDELAALHALGGIADLFLVHDRPIRRHVDDSIVRVVMGREQVLRRARGFAPLPIPLAGPGATILAVGAHLKNAPALAVGDCAYVSRHIGDLDTQPARRAHRQALDDLESLHEAAPATIAHDSHPDYASSVAARERATRAGDSARAGHVEGIARFAVQHHLAHVLSCMAENAIEPPVLGVAWDGTGLGDDGAIWGGEFLLVRADRCERVAHLRPFGLAGGDAAVREPRRSALGVLHALHGDALPPGWHTDDAGWDTRVAPALLRMLSAGVNAPVTTSAGRLFDAVASLIGLRHVARFEGQAAMELEWLIRNDVPPASYRLEAAESDASGCEPRVFDWGPMLERIRADADAGMPRAAIARGFHDALVSAIVWAATSAGVARVALTGGCFQNRYLAEQAERASVAAGFRVYTHQRVPPNDGGIALGQIVAARMGIARCEPPTAVC
jgi:hydrogenase maturation protein HypF